MKPKVYKALKEFEARLLQVSSGATFQLIDPFEGNDASVEVILPVEEVTLEERMKLSDIAAEIEEKYDVYLGIMIKPVQSLVVSGDGSIPTTSSGRTRWPAR